MTTTNLPERPRAVTFRGASMTLVGTELRVGDPAPEFRAVTNAMQPMTLELALDEGRRNALFLALPSLDTPTCNIESNTFNSRLAEVPENVAVFVVSADLPFAQKRWATANNAEGLNFISDYRDRSFATAYGVLLKELGLLTRANFVVTREGEIAYVEIVAEVANEPNYNATLAALKNLR
jgi:thioredoxin-dependent peroxiredoxin